ncbi:MAG: hypothetical protein FRX48_07033 [Lasallia pustulata]|uniref:Uncharacterized protein n=1 Tax=Lasallia pustulata TaxID=136370 RepID=A0A5M8PJ82_9LECA|nr:MAG: hypothetical protein FRX48_07033 [Lasallia pustulata]
MDPTESAASQSKKRKRGLDVDDLKKLFHAEPDDYKIAWNELKHRIIEISEHAPPTISSYPCIAQTMLTEFWPSPPKPIRTTKHFHGS